MAAIMPTARERKPKSLGMLLFIVSDAFTFAALLAGSVYIRLGTDSWPRPFRWSNVGYALIMTAVLGASSFTMARAVSRERSSGRKSATKWILLTIGLGIAFLVLHGYEWARLINEGIKPWSSGAFGSSFFGVTGLHMLHVLAGIVLLGVLVLGGKRFVTEHVEMSGLYWQFVDVVWLFVFVFLYVLSVG